MLSAPASARVSARNSAGDTMTVDRYCAGTVEKLPSNWHHIGGLECSVEPGKASKAILAVC